MKQDAILTVRMVYVHIINWENRKRYRRHLERYFRVRHQIYVQQRGWREVARPINIEIDAFDNEDAIYLLAIDDLERIVGGSRLVPTLRPHLLSEVFPVLAPGGPPRGAAIFEWTRFFIVKKVRTRGRSSHYAGIMLAGLQEACIHLGIEQISVVCESFWPARLRALDWDVRQLGDVLPHRDGDIVALLINVSQHSLDATRQAYKIETPLLAS